MIDDFPTPLPYVFINCIKCIDLVYTGLFETNCAQIFIRLTNRGHGELDNLVTEKTNLITQCGVVHK